MTRDPDLQAFLDALEAQIAAAGPNAETAAAAARAFERMRTPGAPGAPTKGMAPVTKHLEAALATAEAGPAAPLARAFARIARRMTWYARQDRHSDDPEFPNAHANGIIVGDDGLEERADVRIGASLLAPNTFYPDHRHPPEEVYVALSDGAWRQNDGPWTTPGPGGLIYNEPNIVHAMQSAATPLLAIWTLPQ